ncbi:MAG: hypothetical protein EOM25_07765 [Deltaproteobacteria bacterium]|nr:hypothetical protein [Deltaproteobacteria bacterium]
MDMTIQAQAATDLASDKQVFGAQVVSKTLDVLNSPGGSGSAKSGMEQTYDFSQDVLGAYMTGKGTIADMLV